MEKFDPPHLENCSTDFDETWNLELSPKDHLARNITYRHVNVCDLGKHPVYHYRFPTSPFWFPQLAPRSHRLTDLHQNQRVSAVPAKDVPFGVSMMTNDV